MTTYAFGALAWFAVGALAGIPVRIALRIGRTDPADRPRRHR